MIALRAQQARGEQQRITGKEEPNQQAGLREDHGHQVHQAAHADDALDVVNLVEKVDERLHWAPTLGENAAVVDGG